MEFIALGHHPYDPSNSDVDCVAHALHKVQVNMVWIEDHVSNLILAIEENRVTNDDISNARVAIRDASIHLQRLSSLLINKYSIDFNKIIPQYILSGRYDQIVERLLASEGITIESHEGNRPVRCNSDQSARMDM